MAKKDKDKPKDLELVETAQTSPTMGEVKQFEKKPTLKDELLKRYLDDTEVTEVLIVGRTKRGGYTFEHTYITNAYEMIGFLLSNLVRIVSEL